MTDSLSLLRSELEALDRVVVAFSGGADSSLLAWVAHDTLGPDRVTVATAVSPSLAGREHDDCRDLADEWGLRWVEVETTEYDDERYRRNDTDRCFWCKDALMDAIGPLADANGAVPLLGVNIDDLGDHRPGQEAAAARGAKFPLVDAGFTKAAVRDTSKALGLRTWDKPAAPCLASRLPYGTPVTLTRLREVEAAEAALHSLGFDEVRVRHYGELARIEVPVADLGRIVEQQAVVSERVKAAGYRYVTIDLDGLKSGNLNH